MSMVPTTNSTTGIEVLKEIIMGEDMLVRELPPTIPEITPVVCEVISNDSLTFFFDALPFFFS